MILKLTRAKKPIDTNIDSGTPAKCNLLKRAKVIALATTLGLTATTLIQPSYAYWQDQKTVSMVSKAGVARAESPATCVNSNPYRGLLNWVGPMVTWVPVEGVTGYRVRASLYARPLVGTTVNLVPLRYNHTWTLYQKTTSDVYFTSGEVSSVGVPGSLGASFSVRSGANPLVYNPTPAGEKYINLLQTLLPTYTTGQLVAPANLVHAGVIVQVLPVYGTWEQQISSLPSSFLVANSSSARDEPFPKSQLMQAVSGTNASVVVIENLVSLLDEHDSLGCV